MALSTGIQGVVDTRNIKIGAWRWFIAPDDTYIDETVKFNTLDPPAPFRDLGVSTQDTSLSFSKTLYKYMGGLPSVLKAVKVTAITMQIGLNLEQFSGANLARAVYNTGYAIKKFLASPAIVLAVAIPSGNVVQMTSVTGYVEGQYVAIASSPSGLVTTSDEYRIVEISGNYLLLDRDVVTVFGSAPYIGAIESWKVGMATAKSINAAICGVFDTPEEDMQLVIIIPRAVISGAFNSGAVPATKNQLINMDIDGKAFLDTDLGDNSVANILRFSA